MLCEKPVGVTVEEAEALSEAVQRSGKVLQVGHMKRFDAGLAGGQGLRRTSEMGEIAGAQGLVLRQHPSLPDDRRGAAADRHQRARAQAGRRTPRPTCGATTCWRMAAISSTRRASWAARSSRSRRGCRERFGAYCWFVDVEFASGALGHLDLTVAVRMDWHEGFQIYGENGSVIGKTYNPWYYRASDVDIFHEADAASRRVLGADGHFYRRQLEGFADVDPRRHPDGGRDRSTDGVASVRAMVAIARSARARRAGRVWPT